MTPLLQQTREALVRISKQDIPKEKAADWAHLSEESYYEHRAEYLSEVATAALTALDTYEALSEYDKAIHDLAKYLPDGWVAQLADGETFIFPGSEYDATPTLSVDEGIPFWLSNGSEDEIVGLKIPAHPEYQNSLRRIQAGRVVPQGEV